MPPAAAPVAAGHDDAVLCAALAPGGGLLLTGDEGGALAASDPATMRRVGLLAAGLPEAVTAVAAAGGGAGAGRDAYAASGRAVLRLDLRAGWAPPAAAGARGGGARYGPAVVAAWEVASDEINALAVNAAGSWVAAADDAGEVAVINVGAAPPPAADGEADRGGAGGGGAASTPWAASPPPPHRTLRRGHDNIAACAAFRPHRPWELLSGGLDCRLVRWDFSRLRPLRSWGGAGGAAAGGGGRLLNPPMVHCLAVPGTDARPACRLAAAGRGDGCVAVYDADAAAPAAAAASPSKAGKKKKKGGGGGGGAGPEAPAAPPPAADPDAPLCLLGAAAGGHRAAVNGLAFLPDAAHPGRRLASAGNDGRLLLWDLAAGGGEWWGGEEGGAERGGGGGGGGGGGAGGGGSPLAAELGLGAKLNCVAAGAGAPHGAYAGDVRGRVLAVTW